MKLTADEISAVAITLGLLAKHPPKNEGWNRNEATLVSQLASWLKENL